MLRFFSKIRLKLAAENSPVKYIRYAIGEIVLVVIGILIALQVNNWNESRKIKKQKNILIESLVSDLKMDTMMIARSLKILKEDTAQVFGFTKRMSGIKVNIDTLIQIARFEFNPKLYVNITFNDNTFQSVLSTGNLNILDPWMQKEIMNLNEMHKSHIARTELNAGAYVNQIIAYARKYPLKDYGNISPDSKLAETIWGKAKFDELGTFLNALLAIRNVANLYTIDQLQIIQKKTGNILLRTDNLKKDFNQKN